jgi:hypothetical protein
VLGHEIGHVANGDMVTLNLIQGVLNTFVVFLSRIVGSIVDKAVLNSERGTGPGYFITVIVCQILFGILASMIVAWFSDKREFRADAASAGLLGSPTPMVSALRRLGGLEPTALPEAMKAFGINDKPGFMALFSTHPPIEQRIAALLRWPAKRGEGLQVLRYASGAQYRPHFDYFPPDDPGSAAVMATGGQRVSTLVMYLNAVEDGGGTIFPELGLEVLPQPGSAVHFEYCNSLGQVDPRTLHGGAPVRAGEKWIVTKWVRQHRYG